jgi:hypothetical protein
MPSAVLTAGYAVALAAAAYLGTWVLAGAVLFGQAVLAAGWFRLLRAPGGGTGTGIAVAAALLADVAVARDVAAAGLEPLAGVLGLAVVAALCQQLLRAAPGSGRHRARGGRVVASLTATVSAVTVAVLPVGYLALGDVTRAGVAAAGAGRGVLAALVAGAAVVGLVYLVPAEPAVYLPAALAAAGSAGAVLGAATAVDSGQRGAFLAVAGGTLALVGRRVTEYGEPPVPAGRPAAVMLPLALGGPAAYLLGHFLVG